MARIDWVHGHLLEWAQWLVIGDASGYGTKNPLHPEWSPPTPGTTPTLKTSCSGAARRTHQAVLQLSLRKQWTLMVVYCMQLSKADQAAKLECQPATVDQRVISAHVDLARLLGEF